MGREHLRYLVGVALGFLVGAVCLPGYVELFPINVFHREYAIWASHIDFAEHRGSPEPEILVLGDSRAQAALLPDRLGRPARSLAAADATPLEMHDLLDRYLEHHAPPRVLVLSFSPYHLEYSTSFWERTARWKTLRTAAAFEAFRRSEALDDDTLGPPDARRLALRWLRYRLNLPGDYAAELKASRLWMRRPGNLRFAREIDRAGGHAFYGGEERAEGSNLEVGRHRFRPSPLFTAYLRDSLDLAGRRGCEVVVASMPMNRGSFDRLTAAYRSGYHAWLEGLAAEHPAVHFDARLWSLPDDHFGDPSHVNARGARLVTARLAALVARLGVDDADQRLAAAPAPQVLDEGVRDEVQGTGGAPGDMGR